MSAHLKKMACVREKRSEIELQENKWRERAHRGRKVVKEVIGPPQVRLRMREFQRHSSPKCEMF